MRNSGTTIAAPRAARSSFATARGVFAVLSARRRRAQTTSRKCELRMTGQPLVLLIEPQVARHRPAAALEKAGFRSASVDAGEVDVDRVADQRPAVIAAELDGSAVATLELARRVRQNPQTRLIPLVIYGHDLRRSTSRMPLAGALRLQPEPDDDARLVAVVRGVVAASHRDSD